MKVTRDAGRLRRRHSRKRDLGDDPQLRAQWQEMLTNLAPLPTSDHPDATRAADYTGPPVFVRGLKPVANGNGFTPDATVCPCGSSIW